MDLSRFRGKKRLLLVFAASDEGAARQRDLLEGHEEAGTARNDFGVEDGQFAAVLVGKDGTAKFR